jgi:hypothetical protein
LSAFYINSAAISADLPRKAQRDRVTVFVKIPEGIVGLVPLCCAIESTDGNGGELDALIDLGKTIRAAIKAGSRSYHYPLASVSLPRDSAFTDAGLRFWAGSNS